MENAGEKTDETATGLQANVQEQAAKDNLFQEKVLAIGRLHTQRALLANRVGALKSESVINRERFDGQSKEQLMAVEQTMRSISRDITEFSPANVEELQQFEAKTGSRLADVKEALSALDGDATAEPADG